jgi:ferrous iron transport protein A
VVFSIVLLTTKDMKNTKRPLHIFVFFPAKHGTFFGQAISTRRRVQFQGMEGVQMATILLRHMASGQKGVISKVRAEGELGRRIRDIGLVPGTPIQIRGRAPLKDPVAVRVRNFTLTLRNSEADFIHVDVEGDA